MEKNNRVEGAHVFRIFGRMVRLGMPRWLMCIFGIILLGICGYAVNLAIGLMLSTTIDHYEAGSSAVVSLLLILAGLFAAIMAMTGGYLVNLTGAMGIRAKIQRSLIDRWLGQTEAHAAEHHTGESMTIVTADMEVVADFYFQGLLGRLTPVVEGLAAAITIVVVDWRLVLPPLVMGLISLIISVRLSGRVQEANRALRQATDRATKSFAELSAGNVTHRMLGSVAAAQDRFGEAGRAYADRAVAAKTLITRLTFIGKLLDAAAMVLFLGISLWLSSTGQLAFSLVMLVFPLQGMVGTMMNSLGDAWNYVVQATTAGERVLGALDLPQEDRGEGKATPAAAEDLRVSFSDVHFGYREDKPVLRGISFSLEKGKTVALVGPSGSGKSTIFQLLLQFYHPDRGELSVGGTAADGCTLDWWRSNFVYLQQEAPLLAKTVRENIAMGLYGSGAEPTDEQIQQAAKAAGAHDFIMELSEGYDTPIDERGGNLSGGQRQRIAIARAFLSDAPILLLDEPTAALDAESERLVQRSLELLMREKTVLVAAHRLDTIMRADEILVLDAGVIAQRGTHQALMESGGLYAKLYQTQLQQGK